MRGIFYPLRVREIFFSLDDPLQRFQGLLFYLLF